MMNYVIDFLICSLFYLLIMISFYFLKKRIPSKQVKIFTILLLTGLASLILDILCAVLD